MTRIAHLTDLHLLEEGHEQRRGTARLRLEFLTLGRPRNATRRRLRAAHALASARESGADHLVLSGDLTEDGAQAQFAVLADVLTESGWSPSRVTLVPGNHDAYDNGEAWTEALAGPLAPYRATAAPGAVVTLRDAVIVALSTSFHQTFTRSAGSVSAGELELLARVAAETRSSGRAVLVVQHHPPTPHVLPPMQWLDGLREHEALGDVLREHDHVHVVHGHTHLGTDQPVRRGGPNRVFSAEATVESHRPLRTYEARYRRIWPEPWQVTAGVGNLALA